MSDLQILRDKAECIELSNAFAYYLDSNMAEPFADLFTEDGVWVRHGVAIKGRAAIAATFQDRAARALTRHVTTGHVFTALGAASAEAVCYNRSYYSLGDGDLPRSFTGGEVIILDFLDSYVRTPEGWRFSRREGRYVMLPESMRSQFAPPAALAAEA